MDNDQIKKIISDMLNEGAGLSEIQKRLDAEHHAKLTFLELKLLLSEIDGAASSMLDKNAKESPGEDTGEAGSEKASTIDDAEESDIIDAEVAHDMVDGSSTVVEIDRLVKPGTALSGTVKFSSGAKADWSIDVYGRLALQNAVGKPTHEDLVAFQEELRKKMGGA